MKYHSKFGGLWIDQDDFNKELKKRTEIFSWDIETVNNIQFFAENGFIIFENCCSNEEINNLSNQISEAFDGSYNDLLYQLPGDPARLQISAGVDRKGIRIVDAYVPLISARNLLSTNKIVSFLEKIFDSEPLLFQSLSFDMGSGQGLHQDTAYVVVDKPLHLAAAWIALEDVKEGSGELLYVPGSHRLPDSPFWGDKKHWNPDLDGIEAHDLWSKWLLDESSRRGFEIKAFFPKKGDVLLWHADLLHGGAIIKKPLSTRKSLVGHFCPKNVSPNYFNYAPEKSKMIRYGDVFYSSEHYEIN